MGSIGETHMTPTQASDEEANLFAMHLLEIIAKAGPGACLSPSEIASQLPIRNPDAPGDGRIERLYVTGPGVSIAARLINQDKVLMESCKFASEQEINCHSVFMFLNPLLLALLQVEYQVQKVSPFQTHPANVWGFLAATCFYCLGLGLKMYIKSRCAILGHVLLISGAFSSVSLVSIFLPRSLGWLPFIVWAILPFMVGRPLLMRVYHWLYQEILKVDYFGRIMGSTTVQQQHLPQ